MEHWCRACIRTSHGRCGLLLKNSDLLLLMHFLFFVIGRCKHFQDFTSIRQPRLWSRRRWSNTRSLLASSTGECQTLFNSKQLAPGYRGVKVTVLYCEALTPLLSINEYWQMFWQLDKLLGYGVTCNGRFPLLFLFLLPPPPLQPPAFHSFSSPARIVTSGKVKCSVLAQSNPFIFSANQICQI